MGYHLLLYTSSIWPTHHSHTWSNSISPFTVRSMYSSLYLASFFLSSFPMLFLHPLHWSATVHSTVSTGQSLPQCGHFMLCFCMSNFLSRHSVHPHLKCQVAFNCSCLVTVSSNELGMSPAGISFVATTVSCLPW